jgi:hypothetical protein
MLRTELPVINYIFTSHNHVCFVHSNVFRLNGDVFVLNRATYSIAKDNDPLVRLVFYFSYKNTVFSTSNYFLQTSHILYMLFIY